MRKQISSNSKKIFLILLSLSLFQLLIIPSRASYNFDGYPLTWYVYGKIHGDVYVDGGHGLDATPYDELYSIPSGNNITWAAVFIGIWGGTEYNTGWIEAYVNASSLGLQQINGINDDNSNVFGSAHGVYLVVYNITSHVKLNKTIEISVNTGGSYDGRVYGIVLVIVFNASERVTKFCIGYGNVGLHYLIQGATYDTFSFNFRDTYNQSEFDNATLFVSYLATSSGEADYLSFNENELDSDAGDESSGVYFDLDSYNVSNYLESSNKVTFSRGDESYIHPTLAILKAIYKLGYGEGDDYIYYNIEGPSGEDGFDWLLIEIPVIIIIVIVVFLYQYKRKKKITQKKA